MDERLKKQLDFSLEIDKEKNILRQTHLSGNGRNENDAEHAWHMAIMAYILREYANEDVDITKVMLMCLIHDIVEIDAGDTYAYDEERLKTQKAREEAAKERIFSLLPDDQKEELIALFDEFGGFDADALFLPEVKHPFLDNCSFFVRVFDRSAHGSTACTDEEFAVLQDGQILTNGNFRNTGFFAQFRNQDLLFCIELF